MDKLSLGQLVDLIVTSRRTHALEAIAGDMRELRVMFGQAANLALAPLQNASRKPAAKAPPSEASDADLQKQKVSELEASLKEALKERDEARDIATKVGAERDLELEVATRTRKRLGDLFTAPDEPLDVVADHVMRITELRAKQYEELKKVYDETRERAAELQSAVSKWRDGAAAGIADRKTLMDIVKLFDKSEQDFKAPEVLREQALEHATEAFQGREHLHQRIDELRKEIDSARAAETRRCAIIARGAGADAGALVPEAEMRVGERIAKRIEEAEIPF